VPCGEAATCAGPMREFHSQQFAAQRLGWEGKEPFGTHPDDDCPEVPAPRFGPRRAVCAAVLARLPAARLRVSAERTILAVPSADVPVVPAYTRRQRQLPADASPDPAAPV